MVSSLAFAQLLGVTLELFAKKVGWVCLHSIWQGVIVASVLAICLHLIPSNSYAALNARYVIATLSLVALPILAIGTYLSIELVTLDTHTEVAAVSVAPILHAPPMSLNTQSPAEQSSSGDWTVVDEPIAKAIVARLAGMRVDSEILSATRDSMWEAIRTGEPMRLYQVHQLLEKLGIDPQRLHAPPGERGPQNGSSATILIKDGKKTR